MTTTKVKEQMMSLTLTHSNIKKAVKSFSMSKRYINTMLRASVINILYHRLSLEEKEFITKTFNNVSFKSFKPKSKDLFIRQFHAYMIACKDALDKNYLREFYLYFIDSTSNNILENYKFSFTYNREKENENTPKQEDLTQTTCDLLEALNDLCHHRKLDNAVEIKVEFTYFEETPQDYEPPGFRGIDESESLMHKLNKSGNSVIIGSLSTGFHTLRLRGRGKIFNFDESQTVSHIDFGQISVENEQIDQNENEEVGAKENQNECQNTNCVEVGNISVENKKVSQEKENEIPEIMTEDLSQVIEISELSGDVVVPRDSTKNLDETYISRSHIDITDSDNEESEIDCPCKLPVSLGEWSPDIIKCELCKRKYHAPCQGYLDKTFIGGSFVCGHCKEDSQSIVNLLGGRSQTAKPVYRTRFIVGCVYKLAKIPKELQSLFQQTSETLNLKVFNGDEKKINENLLDTLFKFNHKTPDRSKLWW